jgi:hypothetical protein
MACFVTTPHFFMGTNANDPQWIEKILTRPLNGVLEVGFHPGSPLHREAWRNDERLACLAFALEARKHRASLISWNENPAQPEVMPSRAVI